MGTMPPSIWNMNPVEFLEHIRETMPAGYTLTRWFDPPNRLAKMAFVEHNGFREEVLVGYFTLKNQDANGQKKVVWDAVTDAIRKLREKEGASCPVR